MNLLEYGGYAAAITFVVAGWNYIRSWWSYVISLGIVTAELKGAISTAVLDYCMAEMKLHSFGPRSFDSLNEYVRPKQRYESVCTQILYNNTMVFFDRWIPIWVSHSAGTNDQPSAIRVTYLRGTIDIENLLLIAVDRHNNIVHEVSSSENNRNRFDITYLHGSVNKVQMTEGVTPGNVDSKQPADSRWRLAGSKLLRWRSEQLGAARRTIRISESMSLSDQASQLVEVARQWLRDKEWFLERGLPWRMGVGLAGPPGTGKSAFIRNLGDDLDMPIFVFDIATMYNDELQSKWKSRVGYTPAIFVIEDIDAVFHGRTATSKNIKLTFDALLNCIDGVDKMDGVLLIVTTNHPEHLDSALSSGSIDSEVASRPGRIDYWCEFGSLTEAGRLKMANRILKDWPDLIEKLVAECDGFTGAQFERKCIDAAHRIYSQKLLLTTVIRTEKELTNEPG